MSDQPDLLMLRDKLRAFAATRDWDQFHSPKNLSMALMVEVAELMEHFQWLTEAQSLAITAENKQAVSEELADILLYLVRLADKLEVLLRDPALCARFGAAGRRRIDELFTLNGMVENIVRVYEDCLTRR